HHDLRALGGQRLGIPLADALSGPGDDRHLVLEPHPSLLARLARKLHSPFARIKDPDERILLRNDPGPAYPPRPANTPATHGTSTIGLHENMLLTYGRGVSMIDSRALSPSLGVEFTGVRDPLDDAFVHRAAEALKWRGVLLVRGLHLDDAQQLAFSRRLGEVV